MKPIVAVLPLIVLGACRLNPECFGSDECPSGQVCKSAACVPAPADAGQPDAALEDGGVAEDAATPPDAGCPVVPNGGRTLPDGLEVFGDVFLFHLEDDPAGAAFADSARPGAGIVASCPNGGCPRQVCGVYGAAAAFDGDDVLELRGTDYDFATDDAYTIEAWINPERLTNRQCVLEYAGTEMRLCISESGTLTMTSTPAAESVRFVPTGVWTHVAVRRRPEAPALDFFVAGQPAGVVPLSAPGGGDAGDLLIGRGFHGAIDEVRVSRRALIAELDLAINRKETRLVWRAGEDLIRSDEVGAGRTAYIQDARNPRIDPDNERMAFIRNSTSAQGVRDLWVIDSAGGRRRLATDVAPVTGAWGRVGVRYYFVRGAQCEREVRSVNVNSGELFEHPELGRRNFLALDMARRPGSTAQVLMAAWHDCGSTSGVLREDEDTRAAIDVYTSTTGARFTGVRAAPCPCADCLDCSGELLITRELAGVALDVALGDQSGAPLRSLGVAASEADYALRPGWYYLVADPDAGGPLGEAVILREAAGGSLVITSPNAPPISQVDFASR